MNTSFENKPTVSVVIPSYNAAVSLEACLSALFSQTTPKSHYEVIVVDDGSSDTTKEVVERYSAHYYYQKNQGPAAARNFGVKKTQGDIILFTDSDCIPTKTWIEEMSKQFDEPDVSAVKGAYRTNQKSFVARFAQLEFEERFRMLEKAESIDMIDTYSAGFRKEIFCEMKGFDTSFTQANNEDTDLSYRLSLHGYKMVFNPRAIVFHQDHPDSLGRYFRLKFWRGYWRMIVYKRFPGKMAHDSYTPNQLKLQIVLFYFVLTNIPLLKIAPTITPFTFAFSLLLFFFSTFSFLGPAVKKDTLVGILSPFFLFWRAASLGTGILWFFLSGTIYHKKSNTL